MGLSTHEMLIALRVRDEASRILNRFSATTLNSMTQAEHALIVKTAALGTAFTSAGIMITGVGVSIANALIDASNSYVDYASTVAKTFTQVDNAGKKHQTTLQEVGDIGNSVASTLAVKFEEVQPALYDIFSTIETDGPGAKVLLEGIGKAAIGGATDMQTAGRSVMGIMNAWHYSVNDVNKINDVMFQLVRKGVGDYDQFSAAIGKATPSAVKAGQSVEELAAMLAFMTKNGMTSAQAGTSAARAFDMLSNPKFQQNIKQFGLSAFDASGKIRPMGDVVADLRDKIQGMSDKERLDFISKIGKGAGGTIQAMRFINLGLEDTKVNLDETGTKSQTMFQTLRDQMKNSGGAAKDAYDIMSQTPEAKWQGMINQFTIFKNTIGEGIQPIRDFITTALTPMFEWFNKLDPGMKQNIATFAATAAGVLILVGVISTLIGVFLLVSAAASAMGITIGMVLLPAIGIIAAIAALIAIGYLLVTNWDLIKTTAMGVWDAIIKAIQPVIDGFKTVGTVIGDIWARTIPALQNAFNNIMTSIQPFIDAFNAALQPAIKAFQEAITGMGPALQGFGNVLSIIGLVLTVIGQAVIAAAVAIGSVLMNTLAGAAAGFSAFINGIIMIATGFINIFKGIFTLDLGLIVTGVVQIFGGLLSAIFSIFTTLIGGVIGFVQGLVTGVINFFKYLYDVLVGHSIIPDLVNSILSWIGSLPGKVGEFILTLVTNFIALIANLGIKIGSSIKNLVDSFVSTIGTLPRMVFSIIGMAATAFLDRISYLASTGQLNVFTFIDALGKTFGRLPGIVINIITKVVTDFLVQIGVMDREGANKVRILISNFVKFFTDLPGKITSALGNLGNLLVNAGSSIMDGFARGLRNSWSKVTDFVGGIADWIRNNKGPLSKDRNLLRPAGKAIMQGLTDSMNNSMIYLKNSISRINSTIASVGAMDPEDYILGIDYRNNNQPPSPNYTPTGNADSNGNVYLIVNTEEIDPVKHAADLGYEVAKRLGM